MRNGLISLLAVVAVGVIIAAIAILLGLSGFGKPLASPTPDTYFYEQRTIPGSTTAP